MTIGRGVTDLKDVLWSGSLTFKHALSTSAANVDENASVKKYASYTVFKGKAALSISPILPLFTKVESGGSRVDRNGSVMLTFFPAVGQRKYDYTKKQLFALSPTEVGSLISLGPAESCEFFHDPSMKSSTLYRAIIFSLSTTISKTNERLSVPVTKAEFAVMRTALSFALPHIMGWDQALSTHPQSTSTSASKPRFERPNPASEWDRELSDFMVPKEIEVRMKSTMKPLVSVQCTCRFMANVYSRLSYNLRLMSSVAVQSCGLCKEPQRTRTGYTQRIGYNPAETNPCSVMIPDTTFLSSTTGRNCTGEGGDSIFSMASTAIASAVIVLGFLKEVKQAC
ncbi:unnamed protein product [Triticum turgidum subsp. durum]|uniref:Uncharacterized protein n=1 Tax=Triticum turgidum subsp. durum TaxID=4567 RepID=A0A9R0XWV6_TRITD|nr:unnamed protein product [Triticum turgidum subsp. durum]